MVTCVIIGLAQAQDIKGKNIYGDEVKRSVKHINAYLLPQPDIYIESSSSPLKEMLPKMVTGSVPNDGGFLILDRDEALALEEELPGSDALVFEYCGAKDFISGKARYCLYIEDQQSPLALSSKNIQYRLEQVTALRLKSKKKEAREILAKIPHKYQHDAGRAKRALIVIPRVTTESRIYLPVGLLTENTIISDQAFGIFDAPLWNFAILSSRIHLIWISTVCGRLKTDFRYSNTLGWHSFPIRDLTEKHKADLTLCAEDILLAREAHFPATIADLYDPDKMPPDLREVHERNDEVLERVYIGRRFRNDTERLEKLFELYTKMVRDKETPRKRTGRKTAA
jgi:hypothetical protein